MKTAWNKGLTKLEAPQMGNSGVKKGNTPWNKGLTKNEAPQLSNSGVKKGNPSWNKGNKGYRKGIRRMPIGFKHTEDTKRKMSLSQKRIKSLTKKVLPNCSVCSKRLSTSRGTGLCFPCYADYARNNKIYYNLALNSMKKRGMSSLEKKILGIIKKNNLPYKYVGDGKFSIEKKIPDFINTNGQKIAVEAYYEGHKKAFRGSVNGWKKERRQIFKKYGWSVIFIPEYKTKEEQVIELLKGGPSH